MALHMKHTRFSIRQGRTLVAVSRSRSLAMHSVPPGTETLSEELRASTIAHPQSAAQQTTQAIAAITAAYKAGIRRQSVEILLPLIGATDLDDWPGGIRQQFKAASPLVESILRTVKQSDGLNGPLVPEIWDDGDAVAAWTGKNLVAVLFPSAATMDRLKAVVKKDGGPSLLIIVNPQWETKGFLPGQSDFGFGPWRAESEKLVASLEPTYAFKTLQIYGDDIRLLKAYPGQWQVHLLNRGGTSELLAVMETMPTYQQVEEILRARPTSRMNMGLFDRLKDEYEWSQNSLTDGPPK